MKFNSQICTSREQSERLLSLGLKRETADMVIFRRSKNADWEISPYSYNEWQTEIMFCTFYDKGDIIPAWSLGRLIEMLPSPIKLQEDLPTFHPYAYLELSQVAVSYTWEDYDGGDRQLVGFYGNGLFAAVVDAIEWLIKEGYFNKEYLVNQAEIEEHCKGVLEYLDYIRGEEE